MAGPFRDRIREGRRRLHDYMHVDAFYYPEPEGVEIPFIRVVRVRVHDKFLRVGDLAGTNFHYAEIEDNAPRAIFMRDEIEPKKGFVLATDEGFYRIDSVKPPDDISVTANLSRVTHRAEIANFIPFSVNRSYGYLGAVLPAFK